MIRFKAFVNLEGKVCHLCDSEGRKGANGSRKEYNDLATPLILEGKSVFLLGLRGDDDAHAGTMPPLGAVQKAGLNLHRQHVPGFGIRIWADDIPEPKKKSKDSKQVAVKMRKPQPIF